MKVWIVTTGNSDVQLKNNQNWEEFYYEVLEKGNTEISYDIDIFISVERDRITRLYPVPSRVLGIVYEEKTKNYISDLEFPLFNTYFQYFDKNNIKLDRIIVILTDQEDIFQAQQREKDYCPFWQDTCKLRKILTWYFQNKFQNILTSSFNPEKSFFCLQPKFGKGLDHWNETLSLVENLFEQDISPQLPLKQPEVYISHQAGTPAISSAIQFIGLNRFQNVKFILSNQYYDITSKKQIEADEVKFESETIKQSKPEEVSNKTSEYRRSLQIEKAKQLVFSGFPGAALKIVLDAGRSSQESIDELEKIIKFFNLNDVTKSSEDDLNSVVINSEDDLKSVVGSQEDFKILNAIQRIVNSLDLIGFCLKQKNYLQGVALLAATQETFLKTAILHEVGNLSDSYQGVSLSDFLQWDEKGLFLITETELNKKLQLSPLDDLNTIKENIMKKLKFPLNIDKASYRDRKTQESKFNTNKNSIMLKWLQQLRPELNLWKNLIWSCNDAREHENDLRNQLMHNLRGMNEMSTVKYLLGLDDRPSTINVMDVYNQDVKQPFLAAINVLGIPYERDKLYEKLKKIADSLR
ncbi:hypothetical protein [Scytonema sp. NUACC26]|uniref:hypothetical protein n=1 Tax=Scytonema sp. NUACC26 TaxID=3140176 RepID=UPI0034DC6348